MFITMSHLFGARSLDPGIPHHHWILTKISFRYPMQAAPNSRRYYGYLSTGPFLSWAPDEVDVMVGQPKTWLWNWVVAGLGSLDHCSCTAQVRGETSSSTPMPSGPAFPCLLWGVRPSLPSVVVIFPWQQWPALLQQCPVRHRVSEVWDLAQCGPLISSHIVPLAPWGETGTNITSTQTPGASGQQNKLSPLAAAQAQVTYWLWISQIRIKLAAAWSLDTNKALGCDPDTKFLCDVWW